MFSVLQAPVTSESKASAWEAMTEAEKVGWLAVNVMGWENVRGYWKVGDKYVGGRVEHEEENRCEHCAGMVREQWNPLTDWNHWRQVEEKMMKTENQSLFVEYCKQISDIDTYESVFRFVAADLPTRARALFLAFSDE